MLADNNWYGHRYILLKYINVKDQKIFGWIQHGWQSQILKNIVRNNDEKKYPLLFWTQYSKDFYSKNIQNYHIIGSPFLYLCKMLNDKKKINSNGTLVFPVHITQEQKQNSNHEDLINEAEKFGTAPFTACFYYRNFNKKNTLPYIKRGWKVISCVSRNNKDSLFNLYKEIKKHKLIISSEFSSALIYSMYLKKKTKVILGKDYILPSVNAGKEIEFYKKNYPDLFSSFLSGKKSFNLAKIELGEKHIKNKKELKKILGVNSFYKNFFAKIFSKIYDLHYGSGLRKGEDISQKRLNKYVKITKA